MTGMGRLFLIISVAVICSLYYFPTSLQVLPSVNSKMVLAAIGGGLFIWEHLRHRQAEIRTEIFGALVIAAVFSLWVYFSIVMNDTADMTYVTYFVSACVWLGGAYTVVWCLRRMYGWATFRLIFFFLALVGAAQCILAILIDNIPALQAWVNATFPIPVDYYEKNTRLYGIGFAFDTGGIRLSCILLGVGYLVKTAETAPRRVLLLSLFLVMGIVGNFVSRTTVVGLCLGLLLMFSSSFYWLRQRITKRHFLWTMGTAFGLFVLGATVVYLYRHMDSLRKSMDYGFEGFINLFQTGEFSTHSSDLLLNSWLDIWPDNAKTWWIGDGYFADPFDLGAFYAGTDSGYPVMIFYCGLIGMAMFTAYFAYCSNVLCRRGENANLLFWGLFVLQLIVWVKIPTDLFCCYALLLLADKDVTMSPRLSVWNKG